MVAREADGWREQQRERVSEGCVRPYGDGAGGGSSEAGRALDGDGDGVMGCEGVDGVEQLATMAARLAEGDRQWLAARGADRPLAVGEASVS